MSVDQSLLSELLGPADTGRLPDYVYSYPPRQAYRKLQPAISADCIERSLVASDEINLYYHLPFCRQICAFCNLFRIVSEDADLFARYVQCLERELDSYAPILKSRRVQTIYFGGGTPSLLPVQLFDRLLRRIEVGLECRIADISEVTLEVSPETVDRQRFQELRDIGINRVSMGVQTAMDLELEAIGRSYGAGEVSRAMDVVQTVGFNNVCVDLIYGLQGQTLRTWEASVRWAAARRPETIHAYPLNLRPLTGFSAKGYNKLSAAEQMAKYDIVTQLLHQEGYVQETHVRWVTDTRGGYLQKANHWALQNVLGLGAGARSYLWFADVRNGYGIRHRLRVFKEYMSRVDSGVQPAVDGFVMDDDERQRKAIILGLFDLNRSWFQRHFNVDPVALFVDDFNRLAQLGLVEVSEESLRLTTLGRKYRDALVEAFFSERVKRLVHDYDYRDYA